MIEFDSRVQGIPCVVRVDHFDRVAPNSRADSDMDYLGYEELDYTICDRRGRAAPWLERKATAQDHDRIYNDLERAIQ